jgi:Iron-containing redox enzyme
MATTDGLDEGALKQAQSMLGAARGGARASELYQHYWPPVARSRGVHAELAEFLAMDENGQVQRLANLRAAPEEHGRFLHEMLSEIYAHRFGYRDGLAVESTDDRMEVALHRAKITLEREFLQHWLGISDVWHFEDQELAADHLDEFAETNPGVHHPLFEYLRDEAPRQQVEQFLFSESIRNEVVDDEVAMLVQGLQGLQKAVAAANLWDECGRGRLEHFHTYWLRRLIDASPGGWDGFYRYRDGHPWFAKITSNTNAMLLTRPALKQQAYGCFLVFESWVEPHFRHLVGAMDRLGISSPDIRIYFSAHVAVDPRHSRELADGLRRQQPTLAPRQLNQVVLGAHMAAECGRRQYDHWLSYFTNQ